MVGPRVLCAGGITERGKSHVVFYRFRFDKIGIELTSSPVGVMCMHGDDEDDDF